MLPSFTYVRPTHARRGRRRARRPRSARVHAGGTDLLGCLRDGVFAADKPSSA